MKYCKDCKHFRHWHYQYCVVKNYVDPEIRNELTKLCQYQRADGWIVARLEGTCGREGRFYEPKDTP